MTLLKRHGLMENRKIHMLKVKDIRPNPYQPRRIFAQENLAELSESIRQYGVLQPLSVRRTEQGYELLAGERRLRASMMAGLTEVPCIMMDVGAKQSSLIALVENLQRCDLDFFEEAEGIQRLIRQFGLSQDEAARRLGKSQSAIANKLRILRLPEDIITSIQENGLTERHARALLRIEEDSEKRLALAYIVEHRLNVAQTEEYIEERIGQEPEEGKARRAIRTLYVFKDIRLFLNTVSRAVDTMRRSGVEANMEKQEQDSEIRLTIVIPKSESV